MSEFEQDPSANTGKFRAFVERGDDDRSRRMPFSPGILIAVGAVIVVLVIIAVTL